MGKGGGERRNHPTVLDGTGLSTLKHGPSSKKNFRGEQTEELLKLNATAGVMRHSRPVH